jgi:hypothetical protein
LNIFTTYPNLELIKLIVVFEQLLETNLALVLAFSYDVHF